LPALSSPAPLAEGTSSARLKEEREKGGVAQKEGYSLSSLIKEGNSFTLPWKRREASTAGQEKKRRELEARRNSNVLEKNTSFLGKVLRSRKGGARRRKKKCTVELGGNSVFKVVFYRGGPFSSRLEGSPEDRRSADRENLLAREREGQAIFPEGVKKKVLQSGNLLCIDREPGRREKRRQIQKGGGIGRHGARASMARSGTSASGGRGGTHLAMLAYGRLAKSNDAAHRRGGRHRRGEKRSRNHVGKKGDYWLYRREGKQAARRAPLPRYSAGEKGIDRGQGKDKKREFARGEEGRGRGLPIRLGKLWNDTPTKLRVTRREGRGETKREKKSGQRTLTAAGNSDVRERLPNAYIVRKGKMIVLGQGKRGREDAEAGEKGHVPAPPYERIAQQTIMRTRRDPHFSP